jgi:hypothetical protein
MSRGPGKIERAIERVLQTDRSYSVEELALLAYPGINRIEKKHRVAVLRALENIGNRMLVYRFRAYEPRKRHFVCNGTSVRAYVHGIMRECWWNAGRSLRDIDNILSNPQIQHVMEPGGLWWTDVEIHKAEAELRKLNADQDHPEAKQLQRQIEALNAHRLNLHGDNDGPNGNFVRLSKTGRELVLLLGRFEHPGSSAFEYWQKNWKEAPSLP